ncbi:hypothetical protein F503_00985 [Ophiostoma piceae UAMH 11346]|uniref:Uncharacterized protein n=1 Tax=Ophiostoma piceae (strain UAMH 11346) TaxID=1262450 RepID=S3C608_OPHP1|nr:hypothetical protein F503_00985 [Ophiostoma piceae UAMH 11346]
MTGYEFELNHDGNRRELSRQKRWAQKQLRSCNENNRYQHTQTTALHCYGTNPDVPGLRVTMTVYEDINGGGERDNNGELPMRNGDGSDDSSDDGELPVFRNAILVLRHQIIVSFPRRSVSLTQSSAVTPRVPSVSRGLRSVSSQGTGAACFNNTASYGRHVSGAPEAMESSAQNTPTPYSSSRYNTGSSSHHQQGRRFLFATTTIPLRGGVAVRPGYRPLEANLAADRIRQWGGSPDNHVFGNAWLIHMAIEPGHVKHVVHNRVMEQVARATMADDPRISTRGPAGHVVQPSNAVETTQRVNQQMSQLSTKEGSLSVLMSNHITQKRIARQCPDLVAMWVMAQENL